MPQTGIYGWSKVASQGENSKSHVWVDTKPEIILTMCLLSTEMQKSRLGHILLHGKKNHLIFSRTEEDGRLKGIQNTYCFLATCAGYKQHKKHKT